MSFRASVPSWIVTLLIVLGTAGAVPAPAPRGQNAKPQAAGGGNANALPTPEEIHGSFESGNYKETLQKLSRVLALKGDAARGYDRHDLLRLKAETQLKLKDVTGGAATFEQAAREAPDDRARAVDVATAMVIKRSKNLSFTPSAKRAAKGAGNAAGNDKGADKSGPVDLSDPEKRKDAFALMLAEQKDEVAPKLKAAQNAKTLQPVIDALQAAGGLRTLELAATGEDAQVSGMTKDLAGRAEKMMADAIKDMTDTVKQIEESANRLQESFAPVRSPGVAGGVYAERSYKKRGLMTPDVRDLKRVISDCKKLVPTSRELAEKLGDSGEVFKQVGKDAVEVGNKADEVLRADYADSYTRSTRSARERRGL